MKKGEKGIRILAPMIGVRRKKDEVADKDIRKQNEPVMRAGATMDHVAPRERG